MSDSSEFKDLLDERSCVTVLVRRWLRSNDHVNVVFLPNQIVVKLTFVSRYMDHVSLGIFKRNLCCHGCVDVLSDPETNPALTIANYHHNP